MGFWEHWLVTTGPAALVLVIMLAAGADFLVAGAVALAIRLVLHFAVPRSEGGGDGDDRNAFGERVERRTPDRHDKD